MGKYFAVIIVFVLPILVICADRRHRYRNFPGAGNCEIYTGGENLTGYRQSNPVPDAPNPFSRYFDASLVWGPATGRMIYAGARFIL